MKKIFKALKFPIVSVLFLISFIACDREFSTIESDVLGEGNANFFTDSLELPIVAYNKKLDGLKINNLPANLLGVFNDPNYGITSASIVTQLTPLTFSENFDVKPIVESVVINIPYFSTLIGTDPNDSSIPLYKVDSLYGNNDTPIKLSIYQNNYFLRDSDPFGSSTTQNYFSKAEELDDQTHNYASDGSQLIDFDNHLGTLIYENSDFKNNTNPIEIRDETDPDNPVITYEAPALRISLEAGVNDDKIVFWQEMIADMGDDPALDDAEAFKKYLRGLYFKAEAIGNDGNMVLLNLASTNANITINYSKGEDTARVEDEYVLNFSGNRLNTFKNVFDEPLIDGDEVSGDETLYLKGLEGGMAVVDLFPTNEALQDFKDQFLDSDGNQKRLINEAHLILYESDDLLNPADHKDDRIYAYNIENNAPILDSQIDPSVNNTDALNSKVFSLGQRDESGKYLIRITEYLNNIIQNEPSTSNKIGLVISSNVNVVTNSQILNSTEGNVTGVPNASIISPRGTIIHGINSLNEDKQLKLKIFYTEPKAN